MLSLLGSYGYDLKPEGYMSFTLQPGYPAAPALAVTGKGAEQGNKKSEISLLYCFLLFHFNLLVLADAGNIYDVLSMAVPCNLDLLVVAFML